jgi:hypothetical protein
MVLVLLSLKTLAISGSLNKKMPVSANVPVALSSCFHAPHPCTAEYFDAGC